MRNLKLYKAVITDLERIREIYWKLLDSSEEYASILQWKKEIYPNDSDWITYIKNEEMYLICHDTDLVGAVVVTNTQSEGYREMKWTIDTADDEVAVVHLLAVDPDYQGKGIATATLDEIIKMAEHMEKKAVRLDAIGTNKPAQKLYEKYGFINCGKGKIYYESTGLTEFVFYEYVLSS